MKEKIKKAVRKGKKTAKQRKKIKIGTKTITTIKTRMVLKRKAGMMTLMKKQFMVPEKGNETGCGNNKYYICYGFIIRQFGELLR